MYPDDLKYSKEHEWVSVEENEATIGVTHHAQEQLGDIVYVELPERGDTYSEGDEFGTVESVKAVAEVYMPLTGEIADINESLEEHPEMVNNDPHGDGWMIKVTLSDVNELDQLMDADQYTQFVAEESK